jgi:LysM repeat protein
MADDPKLAQLKQKYGSVLNMISQVGVHLTHVHVQDGKLVIQGAAPSEDVKNQVWNQIKLVDPSYSDLTADISVDSSLAPPAASQQSAPAAQGGKSYTVKSGDTLSKIAKEFYGNAGDYMKIFNANTDQLDDPNKIQVGQTLVIP